MTQVDLKQYIVAFIDLLGFSAMVRHDCESPNGNQKFIKDLYAIHLKTKGLEDAVSGLQLTQFSDSIVLAVPYSRKGYFDLLKVMSDYQFDLLSSGILCRGGVSYGKHFSTEDFLFSNGLIEAYYLESKVAKNPRIVVSDELVELIHPSSDSEDEKGLVKEVDGAWFVDFLKERGSEESWEAIDKIVSSGLSDAPSIRSKQTWLVDFYNFYFPGDVKVVMERFGSREV